MSELPYLQRHPKLSILPSAGLGLAVNGVVFACMHFALASVDRPLTAYAGPDLAFEITKLVGAPLAALSVTVAILTSRRSRRDRPKTTRPVEVSHF